MSTSETVDDITGPDDNVDLFVRQSALAVTRWLPC